MGASGGGGVVVVVVVFLMVWYWWWWHSGGGIEVVAKVVRSFVKIAVVLVVGVPSLSVQCVVKMVKKVVIKLVVI